MSTIIDEPLVTVIVPAYNHELYIEDCLKSVVSQTYSNIEVIVINDGSKDKTGDIIENFIKKQKINIKYINKSNEGLCKSLNMGIDLSNGEYITFIASDDMWFPNRIMEQIIFLQNNKNIGLVFTDAYFIKGNNITKQKYSDYKPKIKKLFLNSIQNVNLYDKLLVDNIIPALTVIVRKECFGKVGLFDETLKYEDYDMWLRISRLYPIAYIDRPLSYYRIHETNFSNNSNMMLIGSLQTIFKQYKNPEFKKGPKKYIYFSKYILTITTNKLIKYLRIKRNNNIE